VVLVAARSFMTQGAVTRTSTELAQALAERETALQSVQAAVEEVAASEARLRLLLDAAVDGVVELDADARVVRANGAFCQMVRLGADRVIGRSWAEVAAEAPGGGESMLGLPAAGEAELTEEGRTTYLETRSSVLPGNPPGTLLLIRDVTASRVADQTIRTLFQFLQDRDEDRSRLLRQANQTIEAERNRIARDLHDGPIQGISGATLSIEAVKIMVERGDMDGAADMLGKIRLEISEEAENLRRLMGNLRPPVLEERGLIPAVREMCERFQDESGIVVEVHASGEAKVPDETEILAYRVVQEALSNIAKHARAERASVRVESTGGSLEVEVIDDGTGFDPSKVREFLRKGKVGLASMRERTELGAGTFTIRSSPGRGTSVVATLPYDLLPPP
jgi:PAS domain S-box-containing protein